MSRAALFGRQVCFHYLEKGSCRYGENCRYLHHTPQAAGSTDYSQPPRCEAQLQDREWCSKQGLGNARQAGHALCKFRFMSYNILADELAHKHKQELYPFVDINDLNWSKRLQLIVNEVALWEPDVICFQEVDHFDHLLAALSIKGYQGQYAQRGGGRLDGCATFWRGSKFRAHATHTINFNPLGLKDNVALVVVLAPLAAPAPPAPPAPEPLIPIPAVDPLLPTPASAFMPLQPQGSDSTPNRGKRRRDPTGPNSNMDIENPKAGKQQCSSDDSMSDTEAPGTCNATAANQTASNIQSKTTQGSSSLRASRLGEAAGAGKQPLVLVGNIHVLFNPKRGDVKLGQVKVLTSRMKEMAAALSGPTTEVVSMVGGDFNSTPNSGLYRFMRDGELDLRGVDRKTLSGLRLGGSGSGWLTSPQQSARSRSGQFTPPISPVSSGRNSFPSPSPRSNPAGSSWAAIAAGETGRNGPIPDPPPLFDGRSSSISTPAAGGTGAGSFPRDPQLSAGQPPRSHPTDVTVVDLTDEAPEQNTTTSAPGGAAAGSTPGAPTSWWRHQGQAGESPFFNFHNSWFSKPVATPPPPQPPSHPPPPPPTHPPPPTPLTMPSAPSDNTAINTWNSTSSDQAARVSAAAGGPSDTVDAMSGAYSPTRDIDEDIAHPPPLVWEPGAAGSSSQQDVQEWVTEQHLRSTTWLAGGAAVTVSSNSWQTTMISPSPAAYMSSKMKQVDVWLQRGAISYPAAESFRQQVRVMWDNSWSVHDVATALGKFSLNSQQTGSQIAAPGAWSRPEQIPAYSGTPPNNTMPTISVIDEVAMMHRPVAEHGLRLQSAYATCLGQEPQYTTSHHQAVETVDFVWFTPSSVDFQLTPTSVLLPPSRAQLQTGLPSQNWPSDHISLVVDFTVNPARHRDWWPAAEE